MNFPLVSIHIIVKDGEKYIRRCLAAAQNQSFGDCEVIVFDNNSEDKTNEIVKAEFPGVKLVRFEKNYGLGGGFNRSVNYSCSKYIVLLCVDIVLSRDFLKEAILVLEKDNMIGVLQPKVLHWDFENDKFTNVIDTTGFEIFKSRRIINRGHGEKDENQYKEGEIFSYEGACPVFLRQALDCSKNPKSSVHGLRIPEPLEYEYLDEDFEWYADDIDLGWRMRILGWKSYFSPKVVAYHDRQTTKRLKKNRQDFIGIRKSIPARKKMLDFQNQRLSMVKNEYAPLFLNNIFHFIFREIQLLAYFLIFERGSLFGVAGFFRHLPKMIKKRKWIMERKRYPANEMKKWFL